MSGRAIGTVVGAVIGFYVGGPQGAYYGAMIGGMAGGLIDPETLQGAQFSGRSIAGSESGLARAIIYGTTVVEGRLMDGEDEPRLGTRTEDAGKGGAEIEHDTALLSYAIEICESSELRDTLVQGVLAVWEDEKLVYDVRQDSQVSAADNAKWKANKTFYFGEEGQAPSAVLEGIHGVGNVPAYVGTCRMDVEDEDLILHGERIPRYRFLVSRCAVEPPQYILVTGGEKADGVVWATAPAELEPVFTGLDPDTGANIPAAIASSYGGKWAVVGSNDSRYSLSGTGSWQTGTISTASAGVRGVAGGPAGWLAMSDAGGGGSTTRHRAAAVIPTAYAPLVPGDYSGIADSGPFESAESMFATGGKYYSCYQRVLFIADAPDGPWTVKCALGGGTDPNGQSIQSYMDGVKVGDRLYATTVYEFNLGPRTYQVRWSPDNGATWPPENILVNSTRSGGVAWPMQLAFDAVNDEVIALCHDGKVWTSANGWASAIDTGLTMPGDMEPFSGGMNQGAGKKIACTGGYTYVIGASGGNDDKCVVSATSGIFFGDPITMPIQDARSIAVSTTWVPLVDGGIVIPDAPDYEIDPITGEVIGPESNVGNACGIYLDEVVRSLYKLGSRQLTDDMLDLDALAGYYVRGYLVADVGATSADGIEPLRRTYFFDLPEYDGKINARLRGGDTDWTIDPDDIIPGEESTLEGKRGQEVSFPRKLQLTYAALSTDYKPTTQTAEDINPDTFTTSEESYQTNLVLDDDEAAKVADVMLKVMRTEREDEQKFSLPIQYVGIIASDILSVEGRRYRVDQMRVERNRVVIERAVYDRASAYYSEAVGVEGIRRPPPVSSVRGPVASAVMNLPVMRDADDKAGVYWAAAGYMPGYVGAMLQLSRDGTSFENGPELIGASTMGLLTATLPSASRYAQDNTNTLKVKLYPGAKDLDSTTFDGLLAEANVAAILYADGTAEIVQFQTATETAEREYDLTGLMRGRQDTFAGEHLEGAQFVLLDDGVRFVAIRPDDVGKTLTFRAVSKGTVPEDNATQTITFTTIESLREWQPYNVQMASDGAGGYCVEWIGRARLGSSRSPVHSQWFDGYRVTFTKLGVTYEVDTTAQALCVDAATLAANDIAGDIAPSVTVRARSKVATNDDDFDSPPGDPGTPEAPNTGDPMTDPGYDGPEWQEQGVPPNGYEGETYDLRGDGPDYFVFKGTTTAPVTVGGFSTGITAANTATSGSGTNGLRVRGIPLAAETVVADADYLSDVAAAQPHQGEISASITYAAKPTYAMPNWFKRGAGVGLVDTTPPWTTMRAWGWGNGGFLETRAEFSTGQVRGEFTVSGLTDTERTFVGLVVSEPDQPGAAGVISRSWSVNVLADGTYAVEVDAATGIVHVRNGAGTSIATTTLAVGSQVYRFRWGSQQDGVTIKANFGNESWVTTPTGGFGRVPNTSTVVPVQWNGITNKTYQLSSNGFYGPVAECSGVLTAGGTGLMLGSIGQGSGQHRVRFHDQTQADKQRLGLCLAGQTGQLGSTGTSIGYRNSNISDRLHRLWWTWGGGGSATLPAGFDTSNEGLVHSRPSDVVFAYDATAATIEVWIAEANAQGEMRPLRLWTTVTGVPAGTYFPAIYATFLGGAALYHDASEPAGYSDWTTTI